MKYEEGMHIVYDVLSKAVMVHFRGSIRDLPGPFSNQKEAIRAGEEVCRQLGWGADVQEKSGPPR